MTRRCLYKDALRVALCAALAFVLVSCGFLAKPKGGLPGALAPAVVEGTVPEVAAPVFRPGDHLELYVREDPGFNGTYRVRPEGYILIPKLGRIQVEGYDRAGAEKAFKRVLEGGQLKTATVLIERGASSASGATGGGGTDIRHAPKIRVYLSGQVNRNGLHTVPMPEGRLPGLYEVLLSAGGLRDFANTKKVVIKRRDDAGRMIQSEVNLERIQNGVDPDVSVGDGDIIEVPQRVFGF